MDLPDDQRLAAVEVRLRNLLGGQKRLTVSNSDSLFVVAIGFRRWSWIFTQPEFGMPYLTARLRDIDHNPGTENGTTRVMAAKRNGGFRRFNQHEKAGSGKFCQKIRF